VTAIVMVGLGHWLLTGITHQGGRLSGLDALDYVSRGCSSDPPHSVRID